METIRSKIDQSILHLVVRLEDINSERINIIDPDNFLQCSVLNLPKGKTFRPHKHIPKKSKYAMQIAQESWIVVKGKVLCHFYDTDDTLLVTRILTPGDASFTLHGGHTYTILEENTIVYEYKTGPYEGQEKDKVFL